MNEKNDIKVTFLQGFENKTPEIIRVFLKDIVNNDIQIDLSQGEVVYSQVDYISNSLRIYSKKGLIEIKQEEKPYFLKYYVGYNQQDILHAKNIIDNNASIDDKEETKKIIKKAVSKKPKSKTKKLSKGAIKTKPNISKKKSAPKSKKK